MAITTTARVETYLAIDLDSTQETEMALIISSVQEMMELYCNRSFDAATHYLQQLGTGDREIVLDNSPVTSVMWAGVGSDVLLSIEYTGTKAAAIEIEDQELRLHENLVTTTIDLTESTITMVSELVTAINLLTNWGAEAAEGYESFPVLILNPITRCPVDEDSNYEIDLSGSASWMKIYREREGLYFSDSPIPTGVPFTVIYSGGYAVIPDGLSQLATEMAAAVWRLYVVSGGGILKSEKIGDYQYVLNNIMGKDGSVSLIQMFKARLDQYARISL